MHGINNYLDACEYRRKFLSDQRDWMILEREQHEAEAVRLQTELDRTRQEMAGYLIPEVNDEYLTDLQESLGCYGLIDIKANYETQFDAAEQRRVELETFDEIQNYQDRIQLARSNESELRPQYESLKSELSAWTMSKWFLKLRSKGYFNQDYQAGFFGRFSDWRSVSFLMADVESKLDCKFDTPDQLKNQYQQLMTQTQDVFPKFEALVAERERIMGLKEEHESVVAAPERLLSELYSELGGHVIEHISPSSRAVRVRIANADAGLNEFLKRESGIQKQIQYLRELSVARIDSRSQEVDLELDKIGRKIYKLEGQQARGKRKRFSNDELARMRNVKAEKWQKRRMKTEKMRRRIAEFKKYDKGSWEDDYLWWDLMSNSAPADDIYEVREHRRNFPDWDHRNYQGEVRNTEPNKDEEFANSGFQDSSFQILDGAAEDLASSMVSQDDDLYDPS